MEIRDIQERNVPSGRFFLASDGSIPLGIDSDYYDSKGDILILKELLSNDSLSLSENKSFCFDIPSSTRPPTKPPDDDSGILTVKVVGDISKQNFWILKTHAGFCPPVFTSSASVGNHVTDIKGKDKIEAKTGQNQARNGKRGKVNQVKAKVQVKPVKTGHRFGKSTKNQSQRRKYLIGPNHTRVNGSDVPKIGYSTLNNMVIVAL
nr:hypothetical protein [Tanacetum cinerariifolium]GEW39392.1 hypothetical protein [Tanacetum cinerariifolium]